MTQLLTPLQSLKHGNWFKLICGASYQHLPAVRSLTIAYTLAGADCIDIAADTAVIAAVKAGLEVAKELKPEAKKRGYNVSNDLPLLMVSLNDGEDPHFRKAEFNYENCPINCPRPCEKICPAQAIVFNNIKEDFSGIIREKCYGCGRCLPICPYGIIETKSSVVKPREIVPLILSQGIDAIEIHTQIGRVKEFQELWQAIASHIEKFNKTLKLIAISCNDGEGLIDYLQTIYRLMMPRPKFLIWQTDGRSMSGDIGDGTTIATIKLGEKVLTANLPGYVQLAGGTNSYTVPKLKTMGLLKDLSVKDDNNPQSIIAGVGYGSYARVLLSSILDQIAAKEVNHTGLSITIPLEQEQELLWQCVELAHSLVNQLKSSHPLTTSP